MAVVALHSASTGLSALSTELDIISNNLANVNTTGFRASRANFEDLLYQEKKAPGVENANGDSSPAGLYVGLGTRIANTQFDFTQGSPIPSSKDLDWMIDGRGFFRVNILEEKGGTGYTRAGNFFVNRDNQVVLGNANGPLLDPPIAVPQEYDRITVSEDGRVSVTQPDGEVEEIGQITLANFVNPAGLKSIGGNIFVETAGSGPAIEGPPGDGGRGVILQNHLESSNADPVKELVSLIKTQRAFEMNSQTIKAADSALQVISNLRRF